MSLLDELRESASCPPGDAVAWRERYAPLVAEVLRHREVAEPRVSVVVVAWRSARFVVECLDHVRAQEGIDRDAVELILVDNGGLEAARGAFPSRVDLELRMTHNVGLCPARNAGVAWAAGPIINFVDDDGLVEPDYLVRGLGYFEEAQVAAVRTRIAAKAHRYFTTLAQHYDRGPEPVDDCLVTEGSSFLRREAYVAAGGFAEELSGHEGIELTCRLKTLDPENRVVYAPDAVMHHDYLDSWQKFWKKNVRYASVEQKVGGLHPEIERFIAEHNARRFRSPRRKLDERVAHIGLSAARSALRLGARAARRVRNEAGESSPR